MMQQLNSLIREASDLGNARADQEVARVMQICNACRYCEGFCAVFPAMTRRIEFNAADVHYLANLCHNCGACLHACQYAPPHDFAVNVPLAMAKVRQETYIDFAWPHALGSLYKRKWRYGGFGKLHFPDSLFISNACAERHSIYSSKWRKLLCDLLS
jgi:citrate/tricarballylate utilization protein